MSAPRLRRAACLPPKILEAIHGHLGIAHGVLDILVPEIVLQGSGGAQQRQ
jgi:hypothetical protein